MSTKTLQPVDSHTDLLEHCLSLRSNTSVAPQINAIIASWQSLTASAPTLLAVSGGADSLALLLSLRSAAAPITVAYIRHDQRSRQDTDIELDAVRKICSALGVQFSTRDVTANTGNLESALRDARYNALAHIAPEHNCSHIATGHHADDQLETILHALVRGTGPSGIAGMHASRPLNDHCTLVRPMLNITHDDAMNICTAAKLDWFEDPTNTHIERTRALLRTAVLPALRSINPAASTNASRAATLLQQSADALSTIASEALASANSWPREQLASFPAIILTTALRNRILIATTNKHADRISRQQLDDIATAIADTKDHLRTFHFPCDITIEVHAHRVDFQTPRITP